MGCAASLETAASAERLGSPPHALAQLTSDSNTAADLEQIVLRKQEEEKAAPQPQALSDAALEDAHARYHATTVLRSLLTHDDALGGVPIKLLSARRLITFFQSAATGTRLERRQALEASHSKAFASAEMIERVLTEVETRKFRGVETRNGPVSFGDFPSIASLSHMCARGSRSDARRERLCVCACVRAPQPALAR